jgi:hypothetical protein
MGSDDWLGEHREVIACSRAAPPSPATVDNETRPDLAREWTGAWFLRDHFYMAASPRCGGLLRNGQPCGRTVAVGSEFCVHHTRLLEDVDAEALRHGRTPKNATKPQMLRVVSEPDWTSRAMAR